MRKLASIALAVLFLAATAAVAAEHEREGKIVRIDPDARVMVIQTKQGDQWEIYWTETTKAEHGLTLTELRAGDKVEFEYVERDGKKWATEIEREKKGDR
ncbi:MAG: hypothetical protein ACM3SU_00745 [Acidobacteriota bacterium]